MSDAQKLDPILRQVPHELRTPWLALRRPREGDGAIIFPAVEESRAQLKPWMLWATDSYSPGDAEAWCRRSAARSLLREEMSFLMFGDDGTFVGTINAFSLKWAVPCGEIGYWLRTSHCGRGLVTEAVSFLSNLLMGELGFHRLEIRTDDRNQRSWRVAERCGFTLEGVLRRDSRDADGQLRDTRLYALTRE